MHDLFKNIFNSENKSFLGGGICGGIYSFAVLFADASNWNFLSWAFFIKTLMGFCIAIITGICTAFGTQIYKDKIKYRKHDNQKDDDDKKRA